MARRIPGLLAMMSPLAAVAVLATPMTSTSYGIGWDVVDNRGGTSMSSNHTPMHSIAPAAAGTTGSASYTLAAGFLAPPNADENGVRNFLDNCMQVPNPDHRDANGDGDGNRCDADLNGDNIVNPVDLGIFRSMFFTADEDADLNGNGVVNPVDLVIFRNLYFQPPGPGGIN